MAEPDKERGGGASAIERMKMALAMSERDPNLSGLAEGLSPVVGVLDDHEGRLSDHEKRFGEHEEGLNNLERIAQDYLHRRIDKRDRRELFGSWNKAFDGLDDAGKKDMTGRAGFLRQKFLDALKLGGDEAKPYEGLEPDEAVSRAVLQQLRNIKKGGGDPIAVFRAMSDQMGYKPAEITEAKIETDAEPGKESLSEEGGAKPMEELKGEPKGAPAADNLEKTLEKEKTDKGKNPDAEKVRERAKRPPENRAGGQNILSPDDLIKIRRTQGEQAFWKAARSNAAAKLGM